MNEYLNMNELLVNVVVYVQQKCGLFSNVGPAHGKVSQHEAALTTEELE